MDHTVLPANNNMPAFPSLRSPDVTTTATEAADIQLQLTTDKDKELLPLYSVKQKESVNDVVINPDLSSEQQDEVRSLLTEYKEIFSDVPKVSNLIEHKVELTQREPVRCKVYPTPYKMQEIVDKEIDDLLEMGVIERSEAPYASPLVLVKKPDNTYRVCVNFKDLNKVTVFDLEPMSPDDIFPRLAGSKIYFSFDFCKGYYGIPRQEKSKDYTTFVCSRKYCHLHQF